MKLLPWLHLFPLLLIVSRCPPSSQSLVWPKPLQQQIEYDEWSEISPKFTIHSQKPAPEILTEAFSRYEKLILENQKATEFLHAETIATPSFVLASLHVELISDSLDFQLSTNESYTLLVAETDAKLVAETFVGALRGLETFSQLVEYAEIAGARENPLPPFFNFESYHDLSASRNFLRIPAKILIRDSPRFPFRGLLIDTSRHYLPLNLILRNLEVMAWQKLNVLHWHMTDDNSFPFQSESQPEITKGAYSKQHIYSPHDISTVVRHARNRGIHVMMELDVPGHTNSWAPGAPEAVVECLPARPGWYILNPVSRKAFGVVRGILGEICERFPFELVHLGGDEVESSCWKNDPEVVAFMREHNTTNLDFVESFFEKKVFDAILARKKSPVVWHEVYDSKIVDFARYPQAIVDVWLGKWPAKFQEITRGGNRVLLSACWYLDHLAESFEDFYRCDPRNFDGSDSMKALVLGGHASMWGERVDASNFMARVHGRLPAVAEQLWSWSVSMNVDVKHRWNRFRCLLLNRGVPVDPTQPGFCPHEYQE